MVAKTKPQKFDVNAAKSSLVEFPVEAGYSYEGRNGFARCTGVEIYMPSGKATNMAGFPSGVTLTPRTGKGSLAKSTHIEVSSNPVVLRALAAEFEALAIQAEARQKLKKFDKGLNQALKDLSR